MLLPALLALTVVPAGWAKRGPTYLEQVTVVAAFNFPGYAFATKCIKVEISTVDPRYAGAGPSSSAACRKAGTVPDTYAVLARPSRTSLHWKTLFDGNGDPRCGSVPKAVLVDLFHGSTCAG